jgi:hypothetical protein
MEAWDAAVESLLIDNRARRLAAAHPLTRDGRCARCADPGCTTAELAAEALAVLNAQILHAQLFHTFTPSLSTPRRQG